MQHLVENHKPISSGTSGVYGVLMLYYKRVWSGFRWLRIGAIAGYVRSVINLQLHIRAKGGGEFPNLNLNFVELEEVMWQVSRNLVRA